MDPAAVPTVVTAIAASSAALIAIGIDRFSKKLASGFALAAGIAPWIFFLQWYHWIPGWSAVFLIGLFGSAPLFLTAFFLHVVGKHHPRKIPAATASLFGVITGIAYSICLSSLLSKMA